ncbi:hypothetical protein LX16_4285 [Stackebrandtia albiflava]|uniref:Uncharacterized protein n=1 Tax=Stackebrandtia albiflava TaxID=406432 RepID=A0A562UQZ8_9ACTN|nr:hypothetical protein [Stackebrandtia albiflava]TWJ08065.1 hypothetical protein LX16_4285 [Stackebrandtia albiflava]
MTSLHAVAHGNALNIGTADHLARLVAPGAATPGQLINWIKRFDTAQLDDIIERLEDLVGPYGNTVSGERIADVSARWTGDGADAFVSRWNQLRMYIGEEEDQGRRNALAEQLGAMKDLRAKIQELYDGCAADIETYLGNLRAEYVKALCRDADGAALKQALTDGGTGSGWGSPFGLVGTAAGTAVGAVVGLINGFSTACQQRATALFGTGTNIHDLATTLSKEASALELAADGTDGLSLEFQAYSPDTRAAGVEDWDELENEWVVV